TDEDRAGRELLLSWMDELDLEITVDEMGTIFGRREGQDPELAPVLIGSHIDTVATAGAFDGCLGVLGGLAVLRSFDELERIGFKGERPVRLDPPHAYLECHIEQGPVLAQEDRQIGVVTGVQSISWQKVTLHGRAAHAGTTPTELRIDAGLAAAQIIVEVRRMVDSGAYGRLRATVGHIEASPGLPSVVPDRAE